MSDTGIILSELERGMSDLGRWVSDLGRSYSSNFSLKRKKEGGIEKTFDNDLDYYRKLAVVYCVTLNKDTNRMSIELTEIRLPLDIDAGCVIRIGRTRVTLDTVVTAFEEGATAEEIVAQYPVLALADIYAIIGYYLSHQKELDPYFRQRRAHNEQVRTENERRSDPSGIRARLLTRRQERDI